MIFKYNYTLLKSEKCFSCSTSSLNLDFHSYKNNDDEIIVSYFNLNEKYISYDNIVHGGIVSNILDEAQSRLAQVINKDFIGVTIELKVNFLKPTYINKDLIVVSKIVEIKEKIYKSISYIIDKDLITAKSEGIFRIFDSKNEIFKNNHIIKTLKDKKIQDSIEIKL